MEDVNDGGEGVGGGMEVGSRGVGLLSMNFEGQTSRGPSALKVGL